MGGASYLAYLVSLVPTAANIKNHARIVREKAVLRKLIHSATDIITQSYDDGRTLDIDELLDHAEKSIFEIAQNKIRDSFVSMKNIVGHSFAIVERLYERKEMVTGLADRVRGPRREDIGTAAERSHHHRGQTFHGQDGLRA